MVRTDAASEPASGFGQRETGHDLAAGELGQPFRLLLVGAEHHDALAADADIGADDGAERRRGVAELDGDQDLLLHDEAEPAIFRRDGNAEEAELAHLGDDAVGHAVVLGHLRLDRHAFLAHEAAHGVDQLIARFRIERHPGLR